MSKTLVQTVHFEVDGKPVDFTIEHNLSDFGLNLEDAVINWTARTSNFTAISLCRYVRGKQRILGSKVICKEVVKL